MINVNKNFFIIIMLGLNFLMNAGALSSLDEEYSKEFTNLLEIAYGSDFLSQGEYESVDYMFEGLDLEGKKLLDIGSGLGGVEFYLAQKYAIHVIGIDRVERLVNESIFRKNAQSVLKGSIEFEHQKTETDLSRYADDSFDIVFSKESFLHVVDKETLIKEIFRILKPGGQLIILDWLIESEKLGNLIKKMMEIDSLDLKMVTVEHYKNYFKNAGFVESTVSVMNDYYIGYTAHTIDNLLSKKLELVPLLGENIFEYSLSTWSLQKKIFESNEVIVTLLKTKKPKK